MPRAASQNISRRPTLPELDRRSNSEHGFHLQQLHHHSSHSNLHHSQHQQPNSSKRINGDASLSLPPSKKPRPSLPPHITPLLSTTKPSLLSPSQKKANHIQSEQKRRANIRRGYESLCETVPALREAIRAEEEALAATAAAANASSSGGGAARGKKRPRTKKANDEGEKVDGRAGPRSENVVLQKTIDYINELLADRSTLLTRLQRARSGLVMGHPALSPPADGTVPLWERKWTGGTGMDDNDNDNDSDGSDD
ncbi:hypothetical protein BD410DRAFT_717031 [Rickenella mellea]|uniref:BHLH domain-containing protein n=1 Tax=Rickenella mellea TaxID=50990 RepID=A0A4Y7QFL6_9AGAM|nr:hypothetical protein BD410DRAFT_717031 [Rickenella mellea]